MRTTIAAIQLHRVLPLASSILPRTLAFPFAANYGFYSQPDRLVYPQSNSQDGYFSASSDIEIETATRDTPNILIESLSTLTLFHLVDLLVESLKHFLPRTCYYLLVVYPR